MTEVAIKMVSQARDLAREHLGDDHPLTATCLNNLAVLHQSTGDYLAAAPLFRQALEIRRRELGENHPSAVQSVTNLAAHHKRLARWNDPGPLPGKHRPGTIG